MYRYFREPVNSLTHLFGAVIAAIGLIWLASVTYPQTDRFIVSVVYGLSVIITFTASGIMHSYKGNKRIINWLIRLDHAAIYIMIAGSYTPLAYVFLDTVWFIALMVTVWGMALGGVVWKLIFGYSDSIWSVLYYAGMGWLGVILLPHLVQVVNLTGFLLFIAGGMMYTAGAIVFAAQRPNINKWWGFHEIWHLCVLAGFAFHFACVAHYLVFI